MTLVNICICLVAVYFFYIVGVGRASYGPTCDAMTFLLHYCTLTSMAWMTVNAVEMYKAFTQVRYVFPRLSITQHPVQAFVFSLEGYSFYGSALRKDLITFFP